MCCGCCVQVSICYVAPVVIVPLLGFPACFPNVKELGAVAADKFVNHILGVTIDRRLDFPGLSRSVILVCLDRVCAVYTHYTGAPTFVTLFEPNWFPS